MNSILITLKIIYLVKKNNCEVIFCYKLPIYILIIEKNI